MGSENPVIINGFRYQPDTATLERDGQRIRLELKLAKTLELLLERDQEIVSKADLMLSVWGHHDVSDESIVRIISKLRKIFKDDADHQPLIETYPKKGYRLVAKVERGSPPETKPKPGIHLRSVAIIGLIIVSLAVLLIVRPWEQQGNSRVISGSLMEGQQLLESPSSANIVRAYDLLNSKNLEESAEAHGLLALLVASDLGNFLGLDSALREATFRKHLAATTHLSTDSLAWFTAMGAHAYYQSFDKARARQLLQKAISYDNTNVWANHMLALILANDRHFNEAMTRIEIVTNARPENQQALWDRVWIFYLAGESLEASKQIDAIEAKFGVSRGWTKILVQHALGNHTDAARSWLERNRQTNYTAEEIDLMETLLNENKVTAFYDALIQMNSPAEGRFEDPEAMAIWSIIPGKEEQARQYLDSSLKMGQRYYTRWFHLMPVFKPLYQ
ncbi:MAG: hypothetical protein HEP71_22190 [Roseivirga sp.]|nr:hypothetical protein [Roseivirga sp.]